MSQSTTEEKSDERVIDVSECPRFKPEGEDVFLYPLNNLDFTHPNTGKEWFDEESDDRWMGVSFRDEEKDVWVFSIGRNEESGLILASTDSRFYRMDGWECLHLR